MIRLRIASRARPATCDAWRAVCQWHRAKPAAGEARLVTRGVRCDNRTMGVVGLRAVQAAGRSTPAARVRSGDLWTPLRAGLVVFVLLVAGSSSGCGRVGFDARKCHNDAAGTALQMFCGDGACGPRESCVTCAADCGPCATCGDGACSGSDTCVSCPQDCGACAPGCNDTICQNTETCASCPSDCGTCLFCGDGICNNAEDCASCVTDCGDCPAVCP